MFHRKPYFILVVVELFFLVFPRFSLAQAENSKILEFNGGKLDASIYFASNLFYGMGGKPGNLCGSISSFAPSATMAVWNPASLARVKQRSLSINLTPPVVVDAASFIDINNEVEQSTIDGTNDYRTEETDITSTNVGLRMGQTGSMASGAFVLPIGSWLAHAYFYRPMEFDLDLLFTGFKAKLMTSIPLSENEDEVIFNSFVEGPLTIHFGMSVLSIGFSRAITDNMALGLSLENFSASFRANGKLEVNGTMLFAGQERAFNDPSDLWYNDLNQSIDADYQGNAWGLKLGYSYRPVPNLSLDAIFSFTQTIETSGAMNLAMNTVPALNVDPSVESGGEDQEILDPAKLDLSKLTFTQPVYNAFYPKMRIHLPIQLRIGAAYKFSFAEIHLSYGRYFDEFSFQYGDGRVGMKLTNTLRFGLDAKYVQLGFGFITAETAFVGSQVLEDANTEFVLPLFSIGSKIDIGREYSISLTAISVPMPILRICFEHQF